MKITLLTVGKIKEKYFSDAIEEYKKRLSKYCTLKIVEVADEKTMENMSPAQEQIIKKKEAERINKMLPEGAYVISLVIDSKQHTSVEFADHIQKLTVDGTSHIVFIIGGSIGIDDELIKASNERISFSKMTFPHQLMRVILLEQIYRAFRIIKNEPYHK